jgi:hypothetical protein
MCGFRWLWKNGGRPSWRKAPLSPNFETRYIFADSVGKWRDTRFIVSDAAVAYGVLRVRYADGL